MEVETFEERMRQQLHDRIIRENPPRQFADPRTIERWISRRIGEIARNLTEMIPLPKEEGDWHE